MIKTFRVFLVVSETANGRRKKKIKINGLAGETLCGARACGVVGGEGRELNHARLTVS